MAVISSSYLQYLSFSLSQCNLFSLAEEILSPHCFGQIAGRTDSRSSWDWDV